MLLPHGPITADPTCRACKGSGIDRETDLLCDLCDGSGLQKSEPSSIAEPRFTWTAKGSRLRAQWTEAVGGGALLLTVCWLGWAAAALTGCSGDAPLGDTPLVQLECPNATPVVCYGNLWTGPDGGWNCTRDQRSTLRPRTVWEQPDPQNVCHVAPAEVAGG